MSRYVDAEYVKAVMLNDRLMQGNAEFTLYAQQVETQVNVLPSIDIVRCKECIHCADDYIDVGMGTMSQFTCELGRCGESVQPNDFCSYGEREGE